MSLTRSVLILFILALTVLGIGCGDKDSGPTEPESNIPAELVATWQYQSATIDGMEIHLYLVLQWHQGSESAQFTISESGTFLYEELDAEGNVNWFESGTFSVDGENATITVTSDSDGPVEPDPLSGTWHLEGDILSMTTTYQGATIVLYSIKI